MTTSPPTSSQTSPSSQGTRRVFAAPPHYFPTVTLSLFVLNFLSYLVAPGYWTFGYEKFSEAPWSLVASLFSHGGWDHLMGNMLFLCLFSPVVEKRLGHLKFFCLYLVSGLAAAIGYGFFYPKAEALGASGCLSGVMAVYPFMQRNWVSVALSGLAVSYLFFGEFAASIWAASTGISTGTANLAHVGGGVAGLLVLGFFRRDR